MATIADLKIYLAALEAARLDAVKTGRTGSVVGSFNFENWSLQDFRREINLTKKQIYRANGHSTRRTLPDFSV